MNIFEKAVDDIFKEKNFIQYFTADEKQIVCVSYKIDNNPQIQLYGFDENQSVFITCKSSDYTPVKNAHVLFRGKQYKVDSFQQDAHGLSYKILLKTSFKKQSGQ